MRQRCFILVVFSMRHWKRRAHVFIITHITNFIDITFLFSIFNYFRMLSVESNLEPRCVVMLIGHAFILLGSDSSSVSVI